MPYSADFDNEVKLLDVADSVKMPFGKWKGSTPEEIADQEPSYVVWLHENNIVKISRTLYVACSDAFELERSR